MKNTIAILIMCFVITKASWGQSCRIGIIDFYGPQINEPELRKCLPFIENDTLQLLTDSTYTRVKKSIENCLLSQPMIKQANVEFICCADRDTWIAFIGVDTNTKIETHVTKTKDIKLPKEIMSIYDSLMNLILVAIEKGEANDDHSNGHSLFSYLPARKLQDEFIIYANNNLELLREVLKNSKYNDQREVAADVIAYYEDKRAIVIDLLGAVSDPYEGVRNNSVRAIGVIADYSLAHPDLKIKIPAGPFIDMMNSISWTDRNKSSFVLLSLTNSRNKDLLNQLKQQALKPILDMAKWKSYGHAMAGYIMLGRLAGWSDNEIMEGANTDREASIKKMLTQINN